ncbi:restriction endonuclease subunit S [Vibrio parahaemolyticus]|uniref:restriction endonuclease subunit S n=1 Tax=Vibrio parahaemolyticus TaxID=670 RepID=UPI001122D7CC|nr:restriction endonuclease subunit S [Vibrio parahaemolyticus]TOP84626.1 restriction endonuclease subunit S [Vibrio parahaemolyticus]
MSSLPKLRLSEFSDSNTYCLHKFDDMFSFSSGKNIKQNESSPEFSTPCVRYGELYHMYGEVITKTINNTNLEHSELTFSAGNEILLPSAGEDPLDIGSASALTLEGVAIGRTINVLRPKGTIDYSHIYVSYYINEKLRKRISQLARGASISNVYNSDLKTLKAYIPSLPEQQKVATFLSKVDEKIALLTEKKDKLTEYKKGVMQQLFNGKWEEQAGQLTFIPPTLRFKADDGSEFPDWEEKKLSNFLKESRIKGDSGDKAKKLTVKLWGNGVHEKNEARDGSVNTQYYVRKAGQLIYSKLDFLNCAFGIVPEYLCGYQSTLDLPCLDIDSEIVHPYFLLERVKQKSFYKKFGDTADGSRKAKRIHVDVFTGFLMPLPSLGEQVKITNFLLALDQKIDLANSELEKAKEWKKGLLQQMFV